jgi:hypothetical protein
MLLLLLLLGVTAVQAAIAFEKTIVGLVPVPPNKEPNVQITYVISQQRMSKDGRATFTPYDASAKSFKNLPGNDTGYLRWALNDVSYHHEVCVCVCVCCQRLYYTLHAELYYCDTPHA